MSVLARGLREKVLDQQPSPLVYLNIQGSMHRVMQSVYLESVARPRIEFQSPPGTRGYMTRAKS